MNLLKGIVACPDVDRKVRLVGRWLVSSVAMFRCVLQTKHSTPLKSDMPLIFSAR